MTPAEAGFPEGGRRRTPGLRRQEVALLAGMSVDWYTWMEQARPIQVSVQVIESLARALRLDANERRHLYLLALRQLPADSLELPEQEDGRIGETLQKLLDLQGSCPAMVLNPRMNAVGWNRAARNVYGDYEAMTGRQRNVVWRVFTDPVMKELLRDGWEAQARRRLAQLRAHYANFPGDPWWTALIADLNEASAEFREWWPRHDVLGAPEGNKMIYHPIVGPLVFDHISFSPSDAPDLTVTVNIPLPEFDTAAKLWELSQR
jgi:hypothetical protein